MTVYDPLPTSESCASPPLYEEEEIMPQVPGTTSSVLDCFRRKAFHTATGMKLSRPGQWRTKVLAYRAAVVFLSLVILALTLGIIYLLLVLLILRHLSPPASDSGVEQLLKSWRTPYETLTLLRDYPHNLTDDIIPLPCHAHNDYSHPKPLFQALSVGCISVEADLWIPSEDFLAAYPEVGHEDLLVGHNRASLRPDRNLRTLYTDPLAEILLYQNSAPAEPGLDTRNGIFSNSPNQSFTLLLDVKEDPSEIFKRVQTHMDTFRDQPYLTYWNVTLRQRIDRPLTIVLTGEADFGEIRDETKNYFRDVFFDAPLHDLFPDGDRLRPETSPYNISNSYYASTSLAQHIGHVGLGTSHYSHDQMIKMGSEVNDARKLGLVPRYWGTPLWPVSTRSYVWRTLLDIGVGILNVNDLEVAARWDWSNSLLSYCGLLRGVGFKNVCR